MGGAVLGSAIASPKNFAQYGKKYCVIPYDLCDRIVVFGMVMVGHYEAVFHKTALFSDLVLKAAKF
jgi:hypothetical protein